MKLQVDITADTTDRALEALAEVSWRIEAGETKGAIDKPSRTGLFELLDSQPAAEQTT